MAKLDLMTEKFVSAQGIVMNIYSAAIRRLFRETSDEIFRFSPLTNFLLKIGQGLDEEQRRDGCEVERIEPDGLVDRQAL